MAQSVGTAIANTQLNKEDPITEVAQLSTRVAEKEQTRRDHMTEIDGMPRRDLGALVKVREALVKEYWKLKASGALQLKTGLARNWDYFLVCIPLVIIKMGDLIAR